MASYASEVKKELTMLQVHPEHARVELAALLRMNGSLAIQNHKFVLSAVTENPVIARRIYSLLKQNYHVESDLIVRRKMKLKKNNQYVVRLKNDTERILKDLEILSSNGYQLNSNVPNDIIGEDQRMRSYLRGAFLATGSVNNPETSRYHLEIYSLYEEHSRNLLKMMNHFNLNAKMTNRRNGYIVYLKEAEKIAEFLLVIGANSAMMKFEDIRIVRDMRNSVNRLVNCENANLNKTISAAVRQIDNIKYLASTVGLDSLPEKLQEIAELRLQNPDISLKELGEMIPSGSISKSGINHRLRKINQIAEESRGKLA